VSLPKNFQTYLERYVQFQTGNAYEFIGQPSLNTSSSGYRKKNFVPFALSMVPPIEIPSGETNTREIPAPQQIETKLTSVGDDNNVIAIRDENEEGEGQQRFTGVPDNVDDATASRAFRGESITSDPNIETEVSVSNLDASSQAEAAFGEYLDNLEERYKTFQEASRKAQNREEEEEEQQVADREFIEDVFARREQNVEESRQFEESAKFLREEALRMRNTPPLFLYLNPNDFSVSMEHVTNESKTRNGHVVEHWGMEQKTISASGQIGGFYVEGGEGKLGGLTDKNRRYSFAYKSLMNLFMMYRQNGMIFNADNRPALVGSVRMLYDNKIYVGAFDEFSISEDAEKPFSLSYDFSFTIRYQRHL
jgi:hypothetical protein